MLFLLFLLLLPFSNQAENLLCEEQTVEECKDATTCRFASLEDVCIDKQFVQITAGQCNHQPGRSEIKTAAGCKDANVAFHRARGVSVPSVPPKISTQTLPDAFPSKCSIGTMPTMPTMPTLHFNAEHSTTQCSPTQPCLCEIEPPCSGCFTNLACADKTTEQQCTSTDLCRYVAGSGCLSQTLIVINTNTCQAKGFKSIQSKQECDAGYLSMYQTNEAEYNTPKKLPTSNNKGTLPFGCLYHDPTPLTMSFNTFSSSTKCTSQCRCVCTIEPCDAGKYRNSHVACQECPVNTYRSSPTSINRCLDCARGQHTDGSGHKECE